MKRSRQRGQAIIELALVTTVMFLLLVGALDLGRVFYSQITVTDAAKEGVLVASQGADNATVKGAAVNEAKGGFVEVVPANVTVTPGSASGPCPESPTSTTPPVTVTVKAPFQAITPIIAAVLSGSGGFITASATTPCRYVPAFVPANPNPGPVAAFTVTPTTGTAPLQVTVDASGSTGSPTSWTWDFGDGGTSTSQHPVPHTYALAGVYHLRLIVSNANGSSPQVTHDVTVTSAAVVPPVAAFTATPMTGPAPLGVTVTDNSGGSPTSWAWTFGDGGTSSVQNPPTHTYASPGTYQITLIATNSAGSSPTVTKSIVVSDACASPDVSFTYSQQNKNKPVDFVGVATPTACPVTSWAWTFGDTGTATGQILSHAYALENHVYNVTLTVTTPKGVFVTSAPITTK